MSVNGELQAQAPINDTDRFTGLAGPWKIASNLGLTAVIGGLVIYMVVRSDSRERDLIEEARIAHGNMAELVNVVKADAAATQELTRSVRDLTYELRRGKQDP